VRPLQPFFAFSESATNELNVINNAFRTKYSINILPNAVGFGSAAPRYFIQEIL
jgi:iron complex outermembrane receptor protein